MLSSSLLSSLSAKIEFSALVIVLLKSTTPCLVASFCNPSFVVKIVEVMTLFHKESAVFCSC